MLVYPKVIKTETLILLDTVSSAPESTDVVCVKSGICQRKHSSRIIGKQKESMVFCFACLRRMAVKSLRDVVIGVGKC